MSERYTEAHEWIRVDGGIATVGISDYAQQQLGDVVFVELPEVGKNLEKGGQAAVVESVKAASEIYAPAGGEVTEVNADLDTDPAKVNAEPLGGGWFFRIKLANPGDLDGLMDADSYKTYIESLD
ncbi:MAG: glycine cleavage system protein GcvH [Rhodospirillales bacterium]